MHIEKKALKWRETKRVKDVETKAITTHSMISSKSQEWETC